MLLPLLPSRYAIYGIHLQPWRVLWPGHRDPILALLLVLLPPIVPPALIWAAEPPASQPASQPGGKHPLFHTAAARQLSVAEFNCNCQVRVLCNISVATGPHSFDICPRVTCSEAHRPPAASTPARLARPGRHAAGRRLHAASQPRSRTTGSHLRRFEAQRAPCAASWGLPWACPACC